jgi:hypothetical protein
MTTAVPGRAIARDRHLARATWRRISTASTPIPVAQALEGLATQREIREQPRTALCSATGSGTSPLAKRKRQAQE